MIFYQHLCIGSEVFAPEEIADLLVCSCGGELHVAATGNEEEYEVTCLKDQSHTRFKRLGVVQNKTGVSMDYNEIKTLTGYTLEGALQELDAQLEDDAYKGVPGGADLTDIRPAYMVDVFTKVFGLCGVGWRYEYDSAHMKIDNTGSGMKNFAVFIPSLGLYYTLVVGGKPVEYGPILSSGGSNNAELQYASSGAVTNALGKAASKLCWQQSVYKGKRTHRKKHNAGETKTLSSGGLSMLDAAALAVDDKRRNIIACDDSPQALVAQLQTLAAANQDAPITSSAAVLGEAAKFFKANLHWLVVESKEEDNGSKLCQDLFGKGMGEITIGQLLLAWDVMASILVGGNREELIGLYKQIAETDAVQE